MNAQSSEADTLNSGNHVYRLMTCGPQGWRGVEEASGPRSLRLFSAIVECWGSSGWQRVRLPTSDIKFKQWLLCEEPSSPPQPNLPVPRDFKAAA